MKKIKRWDNKSLNSYFYIFPFISITSFVKDFGTFTRNYERGIYFGWLKYIYYIKLSREW